jgi:hypothetical protein
LYSTARPTVTPIEAKIGCTVLPKWSFVSKVILPGPATLAMSYSAKMLRRSAASFPFDSAARYRRVARFSLAAETISMA